MPRRFDMEAFGDPATVHLHATDDVPDHAGEWMISVADEVTWSHDHGKGDVAVRGAASDLLLLAWGRLDPAADAFEVFGDGDIAHRWQAGASF